MASSEQILSEFVEAWTAGRRPQAQDYVDRAPVGEREELAGLINAYLETAPTPNYSQETLAAIGAEPAVREVTSLIDSESGLWPSLLPRLRRRAKLPRDAVVARLAAMLALEGREDSIKAYYHQMETGTLDPAGVSRRVLDALGSIFKVSVRELEEAGDFRMLEPHSKGVYLRAESHDIETRDPMDPLQATGPPPGTPGAERIDEVDRLFRGGR